ncbi:6-phosphofructokinase [Mucispirillum schaedleri]|uniref:6-phosphofructokinase n=1 Tax=Mucispirillum schaedleri TaxID=248039 RepID=UPI001F57795E|nr:6-phosphofructokinase [Mucispirillum schaedleri]
MKKIGIMTSGGDSPGMNGAIRAAVRAAINYGMTPYGILSGYKGMIEGSIFELKHSDVSNIISRGGTILQTARSLEFKTEEGQKKAVANLEKYGIEGLVVIGGDGSLSGAKVLDEKFGIKSIGIPGSIDNDIYGTDVSLGVDTALNVIMDSIDMINNTASSHGRTFVIEVMGRHCGYLAVMSGIATGADAVIIPEVEPDLAGIAEKFKKRATDCKTRNILIVAEGAGSAYDFGKKLQEAGTFDARITVLGHVQRGGFPTYFDRVLGSRMGAAAVEGLMNGKTAVMTGLQGNQIKFVPYEEVFSKRHELNNNIIKLLDDLA